MGFLLRFCRIGAFDVPHEKVYDEAHGKAFEILGRERTTRLNIIYCQR